MFHMKASTLSESEITSIERNNVIAVAILQSHYSVIQRLTGIVFWRHFSVVTERLPVGFFYFVFNAQFLVVYFLKVHGSSRLESMTALKYLISRLPRK